MSDTHEYKSVTKISSSADLDIKSIQGTGIGLSADGQRVVCWYVLADKEAPTKGTDHVLVLESDYPAKVTPRHNENGTIAYGYVTPGPIINYGKIVFPAGDVAAPASMISRTIWTGTGYEKEIYIYSAKFAK